MSNILLYANGDCKAKEFVEDEYMSFKNDGTVHYVQFIEGSPSIRLSPAAFYISELLEHTVAHLTDELGNILIDESDNYLTTLI